MVRLVVCRLTGRMSELLRKIVLVAATVDMGLFAGLFFAFSVAVMPGLGQTANPAFVESMQRINVAILNPWFFACFLGTPVLIVAAFLLHLGGDLPALLLIAAGLLLYLVVFGITVAGNIPLNNALDAVGPAAEGTDLAEVRQRFENRWVRLNVARTVFSTAGLGALSAALLFTAR